MPERFCVSMSRDKVGLFKPSQTHHEMVLTAPHGSRTAGCLLENGLDSISGPPREEGEEVEGQKEEVGHGFRYPEVQVVR